MSDTKWPLIQKYHLTIYYLQGVPILMPQEVKAVLEEMEGDVEIEMDEMEGEH